MTADIPAAAAHLPERPRESKVEVGPNGVRRFVAVYPDEERRWTLDTRTELAARSVEYKEEVNNGGRGVPVTRVA